jgi:hypothetical protein
VKLPCLVMQNLLFACEIKWLLADLVKKFNIVLHVDMASQVVFIFKLLISVFNLYLIIKFIWYL